VILIKHVTRGAAVDPIVTDFLFQLHKLPFLGTERKKEDIKPALELRIA
jgi:hypothetical protein